MQAAAAKGHGGGRAVHSERGTAPAQGSECQTIRLPPSTSSAVETVHGGGSRQNGALGMQARGSVGMGSVKVGRRSVVAKLGSQRHQLPRPGRRPAALHQQAAAKAQRPPLAGGARAGVLYAVHVLHVRNAHLRGRGRVRTATRELAAACARPAVAAACNACRPGRRGAAQGGLRAEAGSPGGGSSATKR